MRHGIKTAFVVALATTLAGWGTPDCSVEAQPASTVSTRVVVHARRLLDVKTGRWLLDQNISIEGGKIVRVEAGAAGTAPGSTLVDLPNASVLPGFIDAHVHLTLKPSSFGYEILGISEARQTLTGAANAQRTLLAGFTTARNVGAWGFTDVALRDAINEGDIPGPRLLVSGMPLSITGGHFDNTLLPWEYHASFASVADGVDAVQRKVREEIKYGADLIKFMASGGVLTKGDDPQAAQYSLEEMKMIVSEAHRLGRKVAVHAHGTQAILWAVQAGADSIEHGSYLDDNAIAAMKQRGTYLVPTLYTGDFLLENMQALNLADFLVAKATEVLPAAKKNAAHAMQSGVKVALGTDAGVFPHGLNAREFNSMVQAGLSRLGAIQAATVNAADLLGWGDRVGTLEAGKWADLIAVDGDPLEDVRRLEVVKFVMKGGKVYKNEYAKPATTTEIFEK
jgi:imidazolonepropionase-like amidohydrolase